MNVSSLKEPKVCHYFYASHSVHEHHKADAYNETKKVIIVFGPDAIIQPPAMMVELIHTTIALATVLGSLCDIAITDYTMVFKVFSVKFFAFFLLLALYVKDFIRRVT